jgi:hypothetical protein
VETPIAAASSRDEGQTSKSPGVSSKHPSKEQIQSQAQKILQSARFRNAPSMQHLLQFLISQTYGPDAETVKESTIGVAVFSRPPDFDPKIDPVVRVQVHRLRQKLQEYYETDGKYDPILIDIPKGRYILNFGELARHHPSVGRVAVSQSEAIESGQASVAPHVFEGGEVEAVSTKNPQTDKPPFLRFALAAVTAILIFAAGMWIGKMQFGHESSRDISTASTDIHSSRPTDSVRTFWTALLGNDTTPIIAHADGVFLVDARDDLFWFPHEESGYRGALVDPALARQFAASPTLVGQVGKLYYEDSYMGSGDTVAIATLANLFGQLGFKPIIEAGRELTPEDLKQHNVILVGSSFQSYAVAQFGTIGDFRFTHSPPSQKEKVWAGFIEDLHPRPGGTSIYRTERDPVTQVLTMDHALITVEPGIVAGRYIADFGGLDCTGSEGAATFATSDAGVEELSKALAAQRIRGVNGGPPLFQALLSVRLEKGDEVLGTSLIAVRPLSPNQTAQPAVQSANATAH